MSAATNVDELLSLPGVVGVEEGTLLSCVKDVAAATQHTVASHLAKRTYRAILFCKANNLLPSDDPTLVSVFILIQHQHKYTTKSKTKTCLFFVVVTMLLDNKS